MKISVIVPIYGVERYLRQCLDSIAAQSFSDFEAILVDDGGKDGCPAICDEYAVRDFRFKVIHKANAGYGAAVNSGLDLAQGEWIGIVEPDDWIAPDMYATLFSAARDDVDSSRRISPTSTPGASVAGESTSSRLRSRFRRRSIQIC